MCWRALSRRGSALLGLFHVVSLLLAVASSSAAAAAAVVGGRSRATRVRRGGESTPTERNDDGPAEDASGSCRCAADQWEGILRSVDREFYVDAQTDRRRLRAAEVESNTAIHYDFRNGLFASVDFDSGIKTVIDHNMGIQYVVDGNTCRLRPAPQIMNQMCLPDDAQLDGKYHLRSDEAVAMWKVIGPQNATLRATVSLERCLPVSEETFSLAPDYALVTSSRYVNIRVGIRDRGVFDVPTQCRHASGPDGTSHDVRPANELEFYD